MKYLAFCVEIEGKVPDCQQCWIMCQNDKGIRKAIGFLIFLSQNAAGEDGTRKKIAVKKL